MSSVLCCDKAIFRYFVFKSPLLLTTHTHAHTQKHSHIPHTYSTQPMTSSITMTTLNFPYVPSTQPRIPAKPQSLEFLIPHGVNLDGIKMPDLWCVCYCSLKSTFTTFSYQWKTFKVFKSNAFKHSGCNKAKMAGGYMKELEYI